MNAKQHIRKRIHITGWALCCMLIGFIAATLIDPIPEPQAQSTPALPGAPGSFAQLAKNASPSVVNISTVRVIKGRGPMSFGSPFGSNDPFMDFFEQFFRDQMPKDFRQNSLGTGFIIDKKGLILTNNHVVEDTDEIKIKLADEREFSAEIIGRDSKTDLALLRIETDAPLKSIPLGDSDKLEVGDWVIAIGNPFGLGNTVTAGIVSSKLRHIGAGSYDNFIQTDASINPGNSGGPLLNTSGEVIGINTAIFSQGGGSIGIGFAIPINMVNSLLPQLKKGKVVRGWLGVMIQKITPDLKNKFKLKDQKGALVADVTAGGPADKAGIKRGDIIVSFDGKKIMEMNDLPLAVASTQINKTVKVKIIRNGSKKTYQVKIGELKEKKEFKETGKAQANLGMTVEELNPQLARNLGLSETSGLVVVQVESGTPAAEAGLKQGDIILEVDQVQVNDLREFKNTIHAYKSGDTILFLTKRGNSTLYLTLKVRE